MSRQTRINHEVSVHLMTAKGVVFSAMAQALALRTADGTIEVTAQGESYLSLSGATDLTVRTSDGAHTFRLENAHASVKAGRFTAVAEAICELGNWPNPNG